MKYIYFIILFVFISDSFYSQSDTIPRVKVSIVVNNDIGSSTVLEVGLDSLASDDFDFQFCEANLPPLPPPTAWDTRLLLPEGGFSGVKSSFKDYRNAPSFPFTGSKEHRIQYQVGAGTTVTISWNFPANITGLLQDIVTGTLINVPMADSGSYIVTQPTIFNKLKFTTNYFGIIPVELTSFAASVNGSNVNLTWQTATELNNQGFEIERSHTSTSLSVTEWEKIGYAPGFGTTTEPRSYSFKDDNVATGTYSYRLKQVDFDGLSSFSKIIQVDVNTAIDFMLNQNYPNPFNPSTQIKYSIKEAGLVQLKVYDILGKEVANLVNENIEAGFYSVNFNASQLSSGIYFYKLQSGTFVSSKKMLLIK